MRHRLAAAASSHDSDLALELGHSLVDAFMDNWILRWCPKDGDRIHHWLFRHEASGARLLLHLRIMGKRHESSTVNVSLDQNKVVGLADSMFQDALTHDSIPAFSFRSGHILFAAEIMLRLSDRRDLVLRLALRMAGDPDKPSLNTFARHMDSKCSQWCRE